MNAKVSLVECNDMDLRWNSNEYGGVRTFYHLALKTGCAGIIEPQAKNVCFNYKERQGVDTQCRKKHEGIERLKSPAASSRRHQQTRTP
ncbi:uncharacterized protein LOC126759125 isoform X3 [Bactrocera neohumeralis]|uniref:uncharacterized protein LOC126759125 isoform X3 n=1 Tax=Bactrocera neohumeralis TaxID=98809 RepID=UPI0021662A18|nr:uncharacterized protein LOC126759125 isoform X3 [Bactrocera neohumeralis]